MPSPPPRFQIRLLGPCVVEADGVRLDLTQWPAKAATLLRLLATVQEHRLTRDQAIELLWPEVEPEAGISNLKGIVYRLRRVLGEEVPPPIVLERGWVLLNPASSFQIDADRLQVLAERAGEDVAQLEEAASLFREEPLPEDRYEDWAVPAREYLQRRWREVCLRLIRLYAGRVERDRSLQWAHRLLEADPLDEEAVQHVLRLTVALGRRTEARRIFQTFEERLRAEFGTGASAETRAIITPPGNLPSSVSTFVGRKDDLAAIGKLLTQEQVRLLTLTGPGGVGKTRLALEAAREQLDLVADGVYLVSLAPLRDLALVSSSIAHVLGVHEAGGRPVEDALAEAIGQQELLLLLDNLEHLLPAAPLIAGLLAACPGLAVLVTSRVVLQLDGEQVYPVPPLPLPDPGVPGDAAGWASDATALFLQRARSVRPGLILDQAAFRLAAEICRRLGGIPLAIELAAARVSALSLPQIAAGLDDALDLLTGGNRGTDGRQRSLRATLDWSYDLLGEPERTLFCRLSVFAGGWTLEAAGAIGAEEGADRAGVLDLLSHLVDQSLVLAEPGSDGAMRYRMLEPIRQYAGELLERSGHAEEARRRHTQYFLVLVEGGPRPIHSPEGVSWLGQLDRELDNLRAALKRALDAGDAATVASFVNGLWMFWQMRGHLAEGRHLTQEALKFKEALPPETQAALVYAAGRIAYGDPAQALPLYMESLELYRSLGDKRGIANSLYTLGWLYKDSGDSARAAAMLEESADLYRDVGDAVGVAFAQEGRAEVALNEGNLDLAERLFSEGLAVKRRLGLEAAAVPHLNGLGWVAAQRGQYDRAEKLLNEALTLARNIGNVPQTILSLGYLGHLYTIQGYLARAEAAFREQLDLARDIGFQFVVPEAYNGLSIVLCARGCYEEAAELLKNALPLAVRFRGPFRVAEVLEGLAHLAWSVTLRQPAAVLYGAASSLRERLRYPYCLIDELTVGSSLEAIRASMASEADMQDAFERGRSLDQDEAVAFALGVPLPHGG